MLCLAAATLVATMPALAQTAEPAPPAHPPKHRWFVGGAFGATFGTVDSVSISPLVGCHVVPRVDVGLQLFYRWVNDGRYSPSVTTNDYGITLFSRVRVVSNFFLEGDVQLSSYEYPTATSTPEGTVYGTTRSNYNTFLAGAGYSVPLGHNASFYVSALYDFGYNSDSEYVPYDNPWRISIGAAVGF